MSNLVPIKALFDFEKGQLQSSKNTAGEYTFITASSEWKTHESFTHDCEALIFAMAASGSLGRTHYFNGKFIASDLCFILTPKEKYKDQIDLKFYYTIFNDLREEIVKKTATGTSKISINRENFGNYEIPFFDKDHQEQVRTKLDAVHPIKDGLSSELQIQSNLIVKLRASILSDAVSGRLVPQDPNDEPASILLEKIKAEKERLIKEGKIKREKPLPPIVEDEIPYELPDGWVWCRLRDVCKYITDGEHQTPPRISQGKKLLSAKNVRDGFLDYENCDYISDEHYEKARNRCLPEIGDLLIVSVGGTIGRTSLITESSDFALVRSVALIKPLLIESKYLRIVLNSKLLQDMINLTKRGGAQPCLYLNSINQFLFPLPSILEQNRIVAKVEQLMATCDSLEAEVAKSRTETDRLMQTILKEAFE